jgi:hypothetical protein
MPEIKHSFTAAKMNKDLDERVVPNGEYRDALNVQVRTTDGDSSGIGNSAALQNLQGNTERRPGPCQAEITIDSSGVKEYTTIVGSITDEKNDKAYFFSAAPVPNNNPHLKWGLVGHNPSLITSEQIYVDSIIEVDAKGGNNSPVIIDRFAVMSTYGQAGSPTPVDDNGNYSIPYSRLQVGDASKYRIGMIVYAQKAVLGVGTPAVTTYEHLLFADTEKTIPGVEIVNIDYDNNYLILAWEQTELLNSVMESSDTMKFIHKERVLEFNHKKLITGVNIIDDLLFWTDGKNEPKKINITRSKEGTLPNCNHTQLYVKNPKPPRDLVKITTLEDLITADVKLENVTVIKKAPKAPPTLSINSTDRSSNTEFLLDYQFVYADDYEGDDTLIPDEGDIRIISIEETLDFRVNDVIKFEQATGALDPVVIRGRIINVIENQDGSMQFELKLIFIDEDLADENPSLWKGTLEQRKPLFETKFGRIAYRYQYEDNEYSTFSPWSELVFLPSNFSYTPSKGYNEGMVNTLRELIIRDFIPNNFTRPNDVKCVELLWKTTDNANVYIIKSIKRGIEAEWKNFNDPDSVNNGSTTVTSEMIHRVVEANQTLRGWDNVPRSAIAQEITANRLVYGNYIQGYNMDNSFGLKQSLISDRVIFPSPKKSVKSDRNYKFGAVFGDKYGRETPVIANGYKIKDNKALGIPGGDVVAGDLTVEKEFAGYSNRFKMEQSWETPEPAEWMDYVKYYVKETSNEYYNLALDRWYDAEDGAIWLAFASADRNKIDELTYLILKNEHGSQKPVTEKARYKVIAIENEAPDWIKTDNRDLEKIRINRDNVYSGDAASVTDGIPDKLINATDKKMLCETNNWVEIGIKGKDFKGNAKGRIIGEYVDSVSGDTITKESPWKTVSRIIDNKDPDPEIEGDKGVVFRDYFTEAEVNMYNRITGSLSGTSLSTLVSNKASVDNSGTYEIKYYLQLRDAVVENKPQYDGRFFVKVERDDTLENRVLGTAQGNYEIKNTFNIAYINNVVTNPANADAENAGTNASFTWPTSGTGGFTNATIETYTDGNSDGENDYPTFGPGDTVNTEAFWNWWYDQGVGDNTARTTNIFIDNAPAYNEFDLSGFQDTVPATAPHGSILSVMGSINPITGGNDPIGSPATVDGDGEITSIFGGSYEATPMAYQNWQPSGMNVGAFNNGTFGQFTFSVIGDEWIGTDSIFKVKMQTPGTLFRFQADPSQDVYKIIYSQLSEIEDGVVSNNFEIISKNFDNSDSGLVKRYSIIVRFIKINALGEELGDDQPGGGGVDTDIWDPRGEIQQNGIGSLAIDIIEKVLPETLQESALSTTTAFWETEPKEDVGLDIYYEASGAVPIRLRRDNITLFASAAKDRDYASTLSINTRSLTTQINPFTLVASYPTEQVAIVGNPFVYKTFGDDVIHAKHDPDNDDDYTDLVTYNNTGVAIDDVISFKNKNRLVTKSKVVDHCEIKFANEVGVPVPSFRVVTESLSFNNNATSIGDTLINDFLNPNAGAIEVGMEVVGEGIEKGTFVTNIAATPLGIGGYTQYQIQLSRPTISSETSTTITFIKVTGKFRLDRNVWKYPVELGWHNCYSFGNGVESDRIRDDFNAPQIDNGIKVSSTFLDYGEETIGSGMIYSGLYNSTSSVNDLNQFNMAEKITKSLNPTYGSIQALKTRDTNVVVFTEDKVLKVLSNKDAVFNADGNAQLTATNRVLGQAVPFAGDYGISKDPESLAWDKYRIYFADRQRGAVLRLSGDGLTPISDVGMRTYFRNKLKLCTTLLGTFDAVNGEYNLTLKTDPKTHPNTPSITASFNEASKGWVSFKSFIPSAGVSVSGKYFTSYDSSIYEHYIEYVNRNYFYGQQYNSQVEVLFNDSPGSIKSFKAINYEGTQSKVNQFTNQTVTDAAGDSHYYTMTDEYYNIEAKKGWYVDSFTTDLQEGHVPEFIEKEGKWFNNINGITTTVNNVDSSEFSVQGIGFPSSITSTPPEEGIILLMDTNDTD